ncbi:MAG: PAS domain S-box protein [Candidatus Omnitrophica bacterium]|nr:PAS domain S-box protein [Candidatus Omnitrophota bacterium]
MKDTFHLNISTADNLGIGLFKCSIDPKGKFIAINTTLATMLGFSCKVDLKSRAFRDLFSRPHDADEFFNLLRQDTKVNFFETLFVPRGGEPVWVAITASKVEDADKKEYMEGIIEDVSSHKEMEERLALERDLTQGLLDHIPDAIYFKDRNNRIIKVNNFYAQGMGFSPEHVLGKTDFDFFPIDQAQKMADDDNYVLRTGRPIVGKIERTLLPNGTWNQVSTTKIPMYDRKGEVIGTMGITRDMTAYANLEKERLTMLRSAFSALGKTLEMRDPYTYGHNHNVANIVEKIGKALGWDEDRLLSMRLAAELHDLGKISIPLDILNKPGKLNDAEYRLIQEHVTTSYSIIKDSHFPVSLAEAIYQHHERLDGSGYPRGLKDDQIIMEARILAASDVLESMASYRPYRESLGIEKALEELEKGRSFQYDSEIVDIISQFISENDRKPFWVEN